MYRIEWYQGSVLAPTLFNLFVNDLLEDVKGDYAKFADDGTVWQMAKQEELEDLKQDMIDDLNKVMEWTNKWRINLNIEKTEICLFSRDTNHKDTVDITLQGKKLRYNSTPKLLGITLDEKMTFNTHIQGLERKATRSLSSLREVRQITQMKTEKMIQLYICLVRSIMEYGCIVWQIADPKYTKLLDNVQKKALCLCLNMPITSGREALEVIAGVIPIDLRIEQISVTEIAKIQSKSVQEPIKQQLLKYKDQNTYDRYITPMGKVLAQAKDVEREVNIKIDTIEPEFSYRAGECQMSKTRPSYWNRLGSSKSRTDQQKEDCRTTIFNIIQEKQGENAIAFTDGSCLGNPGPCGAGAIISTNTSNPSVRLHRPVAQRGSILLAELVAIVMVLEHTISEQLYQSINELLIFSDSQTAVGLLTLNWTPKNYIDVIRDIKELIEEVRIRGITTSILWTPGHANIQGNDEADLLAKQGAEEAKEMPPEENVITHQDVKKGVIKSTTTKWQRRWDISETGRALYDVQPDVKHTKYFDFPSKRLFNILVQLSTGYSQLNSYHKILNKTDESITEQCQCGATETQQHFLLECEIYERERERMLHTLTTTIGIRHYNMATLLTQTDNETPDQTRTKLSVVADYIDATGRFQ